MFSLPVMIVMTTLMIAVLLATLTPSINSLKGRVISHTIYQGRGERYHQQPIQKTTIHQNYNGKHGVRLSSSTLFDRIGGGGYNRGGGGYRGGGGRGYRGGGGGGRGRSK